MSDEHEKQARGRPRTLNRDSVLETAMMCYWSEGATQVSINEICQRAGVSKPGVYREFGNEDGLKAAALKAYRAQALTPLFDVYRTDQPIHLALEQLSAFATADRKAAGLPDYCLFADMRFSQDWLGPLAQAAVEEIWNEAQSHMAGWIERAKSRGEIDADVNASDLTLYVNTQLQSAMMLQKQGATRDEARTFLTMAFQSLVS